MGKTAGFSHETTDKRLVVSKARCFTYEATDSRKKHGISNTGTWQQLPQSGKRHADS